MNVAWFSSPAFMPKCPVVLLSWTVAAQCSMHQHLNPLIEMCITTAKLFLLASGCTAVKVQSGHRSMWSELLVSLCLTPDKMLQNMVQNGYCVSTLV